MTTTTIEASHYADTEARFREDPIVQRMAAEIRADSFGREHFTHPDSGTPRFWFITQANDSYRQRGGTPWGHLGAIANAVLTLAFDTPTDRYDVKFANSDGTLPTGMVIDAVTPVEAALQVRQTVAWQLDMEPFELTVNLHRAARVIRLYRGKEVAAVAVFNLPEIRKAG